MRVIGITGGVGSGKSEILNIIQDMCTCRIIRADELAKKLENKGEVCYKPLVELLGEDILDKQSGEIVPVKMAARIFSDKSENLLEKVNAIIHPEVKNRILSYISEEKAKGEIDYFFIEAALLIEDNYDLICDELWYIYADVETRSERLRLSRSYSDEKIRNIMNSQLDEDTFRKHCAHVINNSNSLESSKEQLVLLLDIKR